MSSTLDPELRPGETGAEDRRRAGRPAMPQTERYRLLCEAAAEVFLQDGYSNASMDEVARRAGMSKRTLYQMFPSKMALFEATIGALLAPLHLDTGLEDEPDLEVALTGMLEAAAGHLLAPRQTAVVRLVIAEVQRAPELAEAFHRVIFGRDAGPVKRRIAAEIESGHLPPGDAEDSARMLYGMVLGTVQIMLLLGLREPPDAAEIGRLARRAVAVFLRGAALR